MVDCLGLGLCEESYLSNSITNPEMIKVKLCCRQNDFNKVLSTSCNFSTNNIPTRKRKSTDFYRPGATVTGNISTCRRNTLDSRVVRNKGKIFNPRILPSNVNILEEGAYLHQQAMNNLYLIRAPILQMMNHGKYLQTWFIIS